MTWQNPTNIDFSHVEVFEGTEDDFAKATYIGNTSANSYTRLLPSGGAFWYWVRAVNLTGLKSELNSRSGTPCVINAESHEAYVTKLLEDNPYLAESLEGLTERIDPLEINIEGYVVIRALEDLKTETGYQFSNVEQRLDAQTADINLKASRVYVDELAASIISGIIVAQEWKFQNSLNDWTGQNATLSAQADGINYKVTAANPSMSSPDISISGAINNIIGLQLQQLNGTNSFSARIQYKTSAHGYSDAYMKRVEILGSMNIVRSVQVDMHTLNAGGNDWKDSTITGIRVLIDDIVGSEYLIPLVNIGQSSTNELALENLTMRITQAEVDIDGANAAIALKADETTVDALTQRLRQAEIDINALDGKINLKANATDLNDTNQRLQQAEIKIDAVEGSISQEVSDLQILQTQINNTSDATIRNAINEAEGQEAQRTAIALARQELHAEITETNEALATYNLELTAAIDENAAQILDEATARANADEALGTRINTVQAQTGANAALIEEESRTRTNQDNALAQQITSLTSSVDENATAIQSEATTRATQDSALSQRIGSVK